jgi:DNA modification methylase
LNSFTTENYWDVGRFLIEKVLPVAQKEGMDDDEVLKTITSHPGIKFPMAMLKQCQQFFTHYPDVKKRQLPELFYFDLATKVPDAEKRKEYERLALKNKWTISELRKKIHDDILAKREDERTKYGFDLRLSNIWSVDEPDPRFGKSGHKGRLAGQIIANALFYYTKPGDHIIDPFAGSGTLGDIIDQLPYFNDRKYRMYDLDPSDERIIRNNILLTGIPEQSDSADYVFLDPPSDFVTHTSSLEIEDDMSQIIHADFVLKYRGIIRECFRILKPVGRVSILIEPYLSRVGFLDLPHEVTALFREHHFKQIGKAYLPYRVGRSSKMYAVSEVKGMKFLMSDCRELLSFRKE